MGEKKKILLIGDKLGYEGGIERYMASVSGLLRRNGFEVTGAFGEPGRDADAFRSRFDRIMTVENALDHAEEFDLAALNKPVWAAGLKRLHEAFGRRLVFWAHDHDVYCPRRYYYTPFGRKNCRRRCTRFRCACCALLAAPSKWQGGGVGGQLRFLLRDVPRRLAELRGIDVVVISEFMRGNLVRNGFNPARIHLISPFIRVEPEPDLAKTEPRRAGFRLLFLGQLIRGKGCDLFLDMMGQLDSSCRAVIAGDGNDRPMLETKCRELGLETRVDFIGWHSDPETLFAEADAAVLPFRWQEPFGLCGLEAIAHGVPVVAFNIGGTGEWLKDKITGFAVPPFDVNAMASAVEKLRNDPALCRKMSENGRVFASERFSPERFLTAFEALCRGRRS